jgi:acetolactate synthase-1/2/3 large subunit
VVGDGGFQMTSQELAIIDELQLPILIVLINNQGLGIIKQWQELYYNGPFQVELTNPDFIKLAGAYNIKGTSLNNWSDIRNIVQKALRMKKPYLLELIVDSEEGIPLPEVVK